jgi:arsenite methyltransferase
VTSTAPRPASPAHGSAWEASSWRATPDGAIRPGGLALTDHALAACGLPAGARAWDVACGLGATAAHLAQAHGLSVTGSDRSPAMLEEARRRAAGVAFVEAAADALPCGDGALDLLLAECAWSSIAAGQTVDGPTTGRFLEEVHRVLRRGGWLVLSDVYARDGDGPRPAHPLGEGSWAVLPTERELRHEVARAGFVVDRWEDHAAALGSFVGRLVFEDGSLDRLFGADGAPAGTREALLAARPSYFLLIARRA